MEEYLYPFFTLGARWGKTLTSRFWRFAHTKDPVPTVYRRCGPLGRSEPCGNLPHWNSIPEQCLKHLDAVI